MRRRPGGPGKPPPVVIDVADMESDLRSAPKPAAETPSNAGPPPHQQMGLRRKRPQVEVKDFTVAQPKPKPEKAEQLVEFVHVQNRLRKKVGDGTQFDPIIFVRAKEVIKNLAASYMDVALQDVRELQNILKLATAARDPSQHMTTMYKLAHDVKGSGGSFGFPLISRVAESLCWFIEGMANPAETDFQIIKFHLDSLMIIVRKRIKGHGGDVGQLVAEGLEVVVAKRKAHDTNLVLTEISTFMEKLDNA